MRLEQSEHFALEVCEDCLFVVILLRTHEMESRKQLLLVAVSAIAISFRFNSRALQSQNWLQFTMQVTASIGSMPDKS